MNYALSVEENTFYPVTYIIRQNGEKIFKDTTLKGGDLTENQIKELYFIGYFKQKPISIKEIKAKYRITDRKISIMFGYKNTASYSNSTAKKRIEEGLVRFYDLICVDG